MKHTITLIAAILGACMNYVSYGQDTTSSNEAARALAQQIVQEAEKYLGTRYRSGGKGPDSFDCSGFTSFIYKQFGYTLSPSSVTQAKEGTAVETSASDGWKNLQTGDIVVFSGRRISKRPGHVGIYTGPGRNGSGFEFIHAAHDGIRYSNIDEPYYAARFIGVRRILPDFNVNALTQPDSLLDRDFRIILRTNGQWEIEKSENGTDSTVLNRKIILLPGGKWNFATEPQRNAATTESAKNIVSATTERTVKTSVATNSSNPANNDSSPQYHKVKKGDTLYKIAKKNHTTIEKLCELNNIKRTSTLSLDQLIRIR